MALDRGGPGYAWLITGALLLMVLSPLCRPAAADSFPWSSYPMFGHGLPHARTTVHHLVAFDAAGQRRIVPPALVANDEVLQAEATLNRAVRGGRKTSADLCKQVAARIAGRPAWADIVRLELLSERYDAIAYFAGDTAPILPPRIRARCKVVRPGDPAPVTKPKKQPQTPKKKRPKKTRRRPAAALAPAPNLSPGTASSAKPTPAAPSTPAPNLSPGTAPSSAKPDAPTSPKPNLSPGTAPSSAKPDAPTPPKPNLSPGTAASPP